MLQLQQSFNKKYQGPYFLELLEIVKNCIAQIYTLTNNPYCSFDNMNNDVFQFSNMHESFIFLVAAIQNAIADCCENKHK